MSQPTTEAGSEREPDPEREPDVAPAPDGPSRPPVDVGLLLRRAATALRRVLLAGWRVVKAVAFGLKWFFLGLLGGLRRFRTPLVVIPLLVVIVGAGAIGASMLWRAPPPKAEPPPDVLCWNGVEKPRAQCGRPVGAAGLRWVFPGFRPLGPRCDQTTGASSGRRPDKLPAVWTCEMSFQGEPVTYTYTQQATVRRATAAIRAEFGKARPTPIRHGERLLWTSDTPDADGLYTLVEAYAAYPYAVSVSAQSTELRDAALAANVKFRKQESVVVQPDHPTPTPARSAKPKKTRAPA